MTVVDRITKYVLLALIVGVTYYWGGTSVWGKVGTVIVACGSVCVYYLVCFGFLRRDAQVLRGVCAGYGSQVLLAWCCVTMVSLHTTTLYRDGVWGALLPLSYVAVFLVTGALFYGRQREAQSFMWVVYTLATAIACVGICNVVFRDASLFAYPKGVYQSRLTATFINPNHCGVFLGASVLPGIFFIVTNRGVVKTIAAVSLAIVLVALFLTYSLGAWIATVCAILCFSVLYERYICKNGDVWKLVAAALLLLSCVCGVLFVLSHVWADMPLLAKGYSVWQRAHVLSAGYRLFVDHMCHPSLLFLGSGPGSFYSLIHTYMTQYDVTEFFHAHNVYLELLIETGVFSCFFFLSAMVHLVTKLHAGLRSESSDAVRVWYISLCSGIVFFAIVFLFDFSLHIPILGIVWAVVMGVSHSVVVHDGAPVPVRWSRYVLMLCVGVMCVWAIHAAVQQYEMWDVIRKMNVSASADEVTASDAFASTLEQAYAHDVYALNAVSEYYAYQDFVHGDRVGVYRVNAFRLQHMLAVRELSVPRHAAQLGWMYDMVGDVHRAEQWFTNAIDRDPYFLLSYLERARFYVKHARYNRASSDYLFVLAAMEAIPRSRENHVGLCVRQMYRDMLAEPLRSELVVVYEELEKYRSVHKERV